MPMSSTEAPTGWAVVHEDPYLIVVDKPAGLPAQPDQTGDPDLLGLLRAHTALPDLELVHRIDRPVSGLVLFAKDADTLRIMNGMFKERAVRKTYWAIVTDRPKGTDWITLEDVLEHDTRTKRSRVVVNGSGPKTISRLRFRALSMGDRYTLVEVEPEGGAFHQIRVQLGAHGHPIKGDVKYGARRGEKDRSIALHARSLAFEHPVTGRELCVEAPAPEGSLWKALLDRIGGNSGA